jgi:hypothetical protein
MTGIFISMFLYLKHLGKYALLFEKNKVYLQCGKKNWEDT